MTFGERLKELRIENKLTLMTVSDALGFSAAYLSSVENGEKPASSFNYERIEAFSELCGLDKCGEMEMCYLLYEECDKIPKDVVDAILDYEDKKPKKSKEYAR